MKKSTLHKPMKKILICTLLMTFLLGCNVNPSKEARIKKLESEMQQSMEKIDFLETKIQQLEEASKQMQPQPVED